jgi:hypothetical protein
MKLKMSLGKRNPVTVHLVGGSTRIPKLGNYSSRLSRAVNNCPRQIIDEALLHATRNRRGDTGGLSGGGAPTSEVYAVLTYGRAPHV